MASSGIRLVRAPLLLSIALLGAAFVVPAAPPASAATSGVAGQVAAPNVDVSRRLDNES